MSTRTLSSRRVIYSETKVKYLQRADHYVVGSALSESDNQMDLLLAWRSWLEIKPLHFIICNWMKWFCDNAKRSVLISKEIHVSTVRHRQLLWRRLIKNLNFVKKRQIHSSRDIHRPQSAISTTNRKTARGRPLRSCNPDSWLYLNRDLAWVGEAKRTKKRFFPRTLYKGWSNFSSLGRHEVRVLHGWHNKKTALRRPP